MFEQRLFGEHCILVILHLHVSLENGQVFLMNFRPSSLHSLLSTLGAKEEIWSVGRMSRNIGDLLESWTPVPCQKPEEGGGEPGVLDLGGQNPGLGQFGHGGWGQPPVSCHTADGQYTRSLHRCPVQFVLIVWNIG